MVGRTPWVTCFWPGLTQLWSRGSWVALIWAILGAACLNLAILGNFGWSELFSPGVRTGLWLVVGAVWVASVVFSLSWIMRRGNHDNDQSGRDETFKRAIEAYLRGDFFQATRHLGKLLKAHPGDVDARMMLATVMRHTDRWEEADSELKRISLTEGGGKWEVEVRHERALLEDAAHAALRASESVDGGDADTVEDATKKAA